MNELQKHGKETILNVYESLHCVQEDQKHKGTVWCLEVIEANKKTTNNFHK